VGTHGLVIAGVLVVRDLRLAAASIVVIQAFVVWAYFRLPD
jgi:hypothetical protein